MARATAMAALFRGLQLGDKQFRGGTSNRMAGPGIVTAGTKGQSDRDNQR